MESRSANVLLRLGVAFAFLYPPLAALSDPTSWFAYFPRFIRDLPVPEAVLLNGFGLLEVAIALWILSGWRVFIPATIATALLVAIVVFNWNAFDVVFRDLSIAAMSAALAIEARQKERVRI